MAPESDDHMSTANERLFECEAVSLVGIDIDTQQAVIVELLR